MLDSAAHTLIQSLPSAPHRLPLLIVGDVHGCAKELHQLIELAKTHLPRFQLVLVGDLFTKGPDPVGVFELIQEHSALCIKGNHDWALWSTLQTLARTPGFSNPRPIPTHTRQTLHLIRYHRRGILHLLEGLPHAVTTEVVAPAHQIGWEPRYPLIIVHAGIDPVKGLLQTTERMLLTARYVKWDQMKRLVLVPSGHRAEALGQEIPCAESRFRWHELHQGPELIVFGHDAKQGLFRKTLPTGRPICVGIDTGCTYGGSLTGYFPELDLAIQVRAQRKYFDVRKNAILLRPRYGLKSRE